MNMGNTMGYAGNKLSGQQRLSAMSSNKNNMNNLHQQQNYHYQHNHQNKGVLNIFKHNDLATVGNKLFSVKI
jgi:hypothetical protein